MSYRDPPPDVLRTLDEELRTRISSELDEDERVLWAARRVNGWHSLMKVMFLTPAALIGAYAIAALIFCFHDPTFLENLAKWRDGWWILFWCLVALASCGLTVRAIVRAWRRVLRTGYVLTSRRLIISRPRSADSYVLPHVTGTRRTERADGGGDVTLILAPAPGDVQAREVVLTGLANVRTVERTLRFGPDAVSNDPPNVVRVGAAEQTDDDPLSEIESEVVGRRGQSR